MGSMLMRLPLLATTGVGSLPFERPDDAARHAVCGYGLPFCPQLPRAYGDMLQEWLGGDPGRCGWAPDRDLQLPAAWDAFVLELCRHRPEHGVVKLQVTGPLTLAMALERLGSAGPADLDGLGREISGWLAAAVSEQVRALDEVGLSALVMVDEPGLMTAHHAGGSAAVWDPVRAVAPAWGLHVCGEVPWRLVDCAEPDVISYDLVTSGCGRLAQTVLRRLLCRRGRIMWGAVDPAVVELSSLVADRVCAAARAVAGRRCPTQDVLAASMLSGTCGTGGVAITDEDRVASCLRAAASRLRGEPEPDPEDMSGFVPLRGAELGPPVGH